MSSVCVIGGGTAGVEAAVEAARNGAEVTLLERLSRPLPKSSWPRLFESGEPQWGGTKLLGLRGVEVHLGLPATSLGPGGRVDTPRSSAHFDRVVIATGTRSTPVHFPGSNKPGVHILADPSDYLELASRLGSVERAIVTGRGMAAFKVVEQLCSQGRKVTLLGRAQESRGLCRALGELLEVRAAEAGIRMSALKLQRALGTRSLEAVIAGRKVAPCDALAVVPPRIPDYPSGSPETGQHGGVLVDPAMRTGEFGVYSAGGCSEMVPPDGSVTMPLDLCPAASGRVAGANSTGRNGFLRWGGSFSEALFGLSFEGAGLPFEEASKEGMRVVETVKTDGPSSACSLVYHQPTGRIVGAQLASKTARGISALIAMAVSSRLELGGLAYSDLGSSTDISLLQDTARQGLDWR